MTKRRRMCDRCGRWHRAKLARGGLGEVCQSCTIAEVRRIFGPKATT